MPVMKEVSARWLVDMAEHISENPQLIVSCAQELPENLTEAWMMYKRKKMILEINQVRNTLLVSSDEKH